MTHFFYKSALAICTCVLFACAGADQKQNDSKDSLTTSDSTKVSSAAVQFNDEKQAKIFIAYEKLKNELVQTNFESSKGAATALAAELKDYKGCELTAKTANEIAVARDIKAQRKSFTTLSSDVIALFKHADVKGGTIYVQHCPMANNGDGGDWLSSEKKVQNPYYGDEMMECGAVVEEIKAK